MPFEIWSNFENESHRVFTHQYAEDALSDIDELNCLMPEVNVTIAQPIADSPAFFPTADDLPGNDYMQQFEMPDSDWANDRMPTLEDQLDSFFSIE